ncbi:hypothetical protein [Pseudomonas sp. Q2-TVG4-2]|uniref:hypothetical protein n=1 Tax=Pseudomonas sp. Q2-TVG4-2 TaxID=1685699 RepID=UPI0015E640DE|nr:hypothetical protein [Pseudomonas sp. Q2-TVG4-2]
MNHSRGARRRRESLAGSRVSLAGVAQARLGSGVSMMPVWHLHEAEVGAEVIRAALRLIREN